MAGFHFRYRLGGGDPTVESFRFRNSETLSLGDLVHLESGEVALGASGDRSLLGAVVETKRGQTSEATIDIIVDGDAVYGVGDRSGRPAGGTLDLIGTSGGQSVAAGSNGDLVVVVDSPASDETLVRINLGAHHEVAAHDESAGQPAARPHLSRERERELVQAAEEGDGAALAELVEAFLPTIAGVARMYRGTVAVERSELIQEGVVGLLKALKRYDSSLGTPFWAYASWWVRKAMQQLVSEVTRPVVLSDRALRYLARIRDARREHLQSQGAAPTPAQLAEATELSVAQVESLLAIERTPRSLEEPIGHEDDGGTFEDFVPDPVAEDEYERVMERLQIEDVRDLSTELDDRERGIVYDHYGLEGPAQTLREISEDLGVSVERVRQIEERALDKLRASVMA